LFDRLLNARLPSTRVLALYNTLALAAKPFALGWAAWHGRDPGRARECAQRLARELPEQLVGSLWLHGASVGEARVVSALATRLGERFPDRPQALSAITSSGLRQLPDNGTRFILPFDFSGYPARLLERLDPRLLVLVETELWPNLIHEAAAANVPIAMVSARLAPERMARYRRWSSLYRPLLERVEIIGAQTAEDAERFELLGAAARAISVTGNLKYDLAAPQIDHELLERRLGNRAGRPVLVAGSTRPGEEPIVLEAFDVLRRSFPDLLLVLAPRHLERVEEILDLTQATWNTAIWSSLEPGEHAAPDIVVIDTLGELASLYGIASVAFVGGTLKPFGGHSPLEPAAAGVPVLIGPHSNHFAEPVRELIAAGGARRVADAVDLSAAASAWLVDAGPRDKAGSAARETIRAHAGALGRTIDTIAPFIERGAA
jgi:3-deoxy-D-manno-octulosonic-acid transferase